MMPPQEKRALITGITGQDGSYLAELLLAKGYEVHGVIRRASTFNTDRIDHLYSDPHESPALYLHYGDLSEGRVIRQILEKHQPLEIYNLGAQSHVRVSFDQPEYTADVVGLGTLRLLEAVRDYNGRSGTQAKVYQAGSSEMYGAAAPPQHEGTSFHPRSPYAVSKVAAHWFARNYREAYGMFVTNGILFNHESPRRGETFVTRKITRAIGRIREGLQEKLYLGNLEAVRDWGFAGDYVDAMWLMLQQQEPDDFVIATGESHSVREFLELAFGHASLDWRKHVEIDPRYFRPSEVDCLRGDASKAQTKLGWTPKVAFTELVQMMVEHDFEVARRERALLESGRGDAIPEARLSHRAHTELDTGVLQLVRARATCDSTQGYVRAMPSLRVKRGCQPVE
jgi:GDPmannose 4,6-dehydratase